MKITKFILNIKLEENVRNRSLKIEQLFDNFPSVLESEYPINIETTSSEIIFNGVRYLCYADKQNYQIVNGEIHSIRNITVDTVEVYRETNTENELFLPF